MSKTSDPGYVESSVTNLREPNYIPCSTETVTASCTLCGKPLTVGHVCLIDPPPEMGGLERLAVELGFHSTEELGVGERRYLSPDEVLAEFPPVPDDDGSCPSCGEKDITFPHSCYPVSDINKIEPNRFDPYEALDRILVGVEEIAEHPKMLVVQTNEFGVIRDKVDALRAYITGMEK